MVAPVAVPQDIAAVSYDGRVATVAEGRDKQCESKAEQSCKRARTKRCLRKDGCAWMRVSSVLRSQTDRDKYIR